MGQVFLLDVVAYLHEPARRSKSECRTQRNGFLAVLYKVLLKVQLLIKLPVFQIICCFRFVLLLKISLMYRTFLMKVSLYIYIYTYICMQLFKNLFVRHSSDETSHLPTLKSYKQRVKYKSRVKNKQIHYTSIAIREVFQQQTRAKWLLNCLNNSGTGFVRYIMTIKSIFI